MTKPPDGLRSIRDQRLNVDKRHFRIIFSVAFMIYVVAFSIGRLLPVSWRSRFYGFDGKTGIIEQASVQANILASYAIMN